jgi:hypothetical protein
MILKPLLTKINSELVRISSQLDIMQAVYDSEMFCCVIRIGSKKEFKKKLINEEIIFCTYTFEEYNSTAV